MLTPIMSQLVAAVIGLILSKMSGMPSKAYIVTFTVVLINTAVYCLSHFFLQITYLEKYVAYRHYFAD